MTYMLNDIDEAIDRKFLVTKSMSNQVPAGTIVHIMGADQEKDGSVTVYYRITYTKQDYTVKFDNLKAFCKWARPDNFIARHYESFSTKEIQRYIRIKDRNFTNFCLPIILAALAVVWAVILLSVKSLDITKRAIIASVVSVVAIIVITVLYKTLKQKAMTRLYSKVSAKSNWGVRFK